MDLPVSHLGLSLLAGSLTTLSPCVFPILPMVLGGAAQGNRLAPLAMGLGMALSFAGIGVVIGALGPVIGLDSDHVRLFGAVLLMALGVMMWVPALNERFTQWMMPLASGANNMSSRLQGDTLWGGAAFGRGVGLGLEPLLRPFVGIGLDAGGQRRWCAAWGHCVGYLRPGCGFAFGGGGLRLASGLSVGARQSAGAWRQGQESVWRFDLSGRSGHCQRRRQVVGGANSALVARGLVTGNHLVLSKFDIHSFPIFDLPRRTFL